PASGRRCGSRARARSCTCLRESRLQLSVYCCEQCGNWPLVLWIHSKSCGLVYRAAREALDVNRNTLEHVAEPLDHGLGLKHDAHDIETDLLPRHVGAPGVIVGC